jgi:hypothetical protein
MHSIGRDPLLWFLPSFRLERVEGLWGSADSKPLIVEEVKSFMFFINNPAESKRLNIFL